ncbi:MAG: winged helix-turn-helix domain-containing protein [Candidatus Thermoplasmatota archaeon]|nr:winged helix-turn-helix domain-containing protein [Candidatus Thermoplasmatota archaeon]
MESSELSKELKALNQRIDELETILKKIVEPFQEMKKSTSNYFRLISLLLEHGGLTPDTLFSEIKDPIEKTIIQVLAQKRELNISQITENVRSRRGTASRRIIREKLRNLEKEHMIESHQQGSRVLYCLTDEVIKKWSQVLGLI